MATTYNPRIVTNGLIMYLDAANPQSYSGSGTTWTNLSNTSSVGTLTNGPSFTSSNKGSIVFDGVNDLVKLNNNQLADNLSSMTVSAFVYANWGAAGDVYRPIVTKMDNIGTGAGWELGATWIGGGNNIYLITQNNGGNLWNARSVDNIVTGNNWLHISASYYDLGTTSHIIYLNGVSRPLTNQSSGAPLNITTTSSIAIASRDGSNGGAFIMPYYSCTVATVQIYNRVLSSAEVLQNFNALRGRFGV